MKEKKHVPMDARAPLKLEDVPELDDFVEKIANILIVWAEELAKKEEPSTIKNTHPND